MIIFLYGPDSYRRLKKLQELEEAYRGKKGNLSQEHFDFKEEGATMAFKDFIINRSMFSDVKLAVLENIYEVADDKKFSELLKNERDSEGSVVLIDGDDEPPVNLKFLLEKPIRSQIFKALEGSQLKFFIDKEAADRGLKINAHTIESIKNTFGSDTWGIITELDKMTLMNNHFKFSKPQADYYPLINILKMGSDPRRKLVALETILSERRDDPARVFNTLSYRLSNKKEAARLADYDIAVKSGKLDYEEVLVDFALS